LEKYKDVFTAEMRTIRLLRQLNHPNIVTLLGSYTYNDEHHFLFPVFEMDLEKLFEQDSRFGEFIWNFTFPLALCALASALECTHNLHLNAATNGLDFEAVGYHHDLRPANILARKDTFVLADFGLSKLKPAEANSQTPWKIGCGDYIAPECMGANFVHQQVGRAVDVWAFGCLVTEIVTYIGHGPEGLLHFRRSRMGEIQPGFNTTYFYGPGSQLKDSVRLWFEEVESTSPTWVRELLQIARRCLEPRPDARPRISQIRSELGIHALRVLFTDTLDKFTQYSEDNVSVGGREFGPMQWWFERERLKAFGKALHSGIGAGSGIFDDFDSFRKCADLLLSLFRLLQPRLYSSASEAPSTVQVETKIDLRGPIDEQAQQIIHDLWDLYPPTHARNAQAAWLGSIRQRDMDRLDSIDNLLASHWRKDLVDFGAMAHMRAIQLEMLNDPETGPVGYLHPRKDVDTIKFVNDHTYGQYKNSKYVLVEWMYYRSEWTKIPLDQRLIIMELRAKDFNVDPKPRGLRILKCLGFFEQQQGQNRRHGYGFIYELPTEVQTRDKFVPPITLRQLLLQGVHPEKGTSSQAPLRGRLLLAHALGLFFEAFYGVGCLHETFNSGNVIFARSIPEMLLSSSVWNEPYVVGFQRCRPDGQQWATEGPSDDRSFHSYEHPDYADNGRFLLEFDYYSLGLVLLEIGLWCPLQMWSQRDEYRKLTPSQFRVVLLEKYVPRLATTVGEIYREVVRTCIDGTLERDREKMSAEDANAEIFDIFAERVVRPLDELSRLRL
jgi:serine/threonine protein kinase